MDFNAAFTRMANATSRAAGRASVFLAACAMVVIWACTGPLFGYSETWQLIINTGTTIVTFLMVFLIQNTQNRDNAALHSKLDEMIRAGDAKNKFIGIETLPEEKIIELQKEIQAAAGSATKSVAPISRSETQKVRRPEPR